MDRIHAVVDFMRRHQTPSSASFWLVANCLQILQGGNFAQPLQIMGGGLDIVGSIAGVTLKEDGELLMCDAYIASGAFFIANGITAPTVQTAISQVIYGALIIAGAITLYQGEQIMKVLKKISPMARLMNRLSKLTPKLIGANLFNLSCASLMAGAFTDILQGLTRHQSHLLHHGELTIAIASTYVAGNVIAGLKSFAAKEMEMHTRSSAKAANNLQI